VDKILAWLKGPDFLRIYEEALSQRLSKTGVWFIESEEFRQFVEGRDVIVWGTGMPGAGKTLLSSTSMEHLREVFEDHQGIAIICAFIRYTEKLSICDILVGLLRQLVDRHPCASRHMGCVYTRNQKMELREQGLVKALQDIIGLLSKVFIIVDGLDEAEDAVKDALLRTLPTRGANVLIMSRPLELFTSCLPDALHISIEARTEDIDRFIDDQIQLNSRLRAVVRGDPTLVEKLKARVRESSKGMFLVARLQMEDVIRKARNANTLLRELDHLPSGVDAIYEHTLARIGAQSEEDASIAYRVFIWLVYARHTIHTTRLQEALAISFENTSYDAGDVIPVDLILSLCGGLVISEASCRLRLIHYTAYEYLKGIKFPGLARPHTYLAVSCLVYLQYCNYQTCKEDQSLNVNAQPLCWYAEINWGYHARNSQDEDVDIHPYILTFLRTCGTHYQHSFERDLSFHQLNGLHLAAIYGLVKVISTRSLPFLPGRIYSWRSAEWIKGQTPFHYAVKYGGTLILKVLLDCYTGINEQDARGETALMTAAFSTCDGLQDRGGDWEPCIPRVKDQVEIFRTLAGAPDLEVDLKDADGRTAFMIACMLSRNEHSPITLLTMRPDINPNLKDNDGMTAFMYACKFGTRALAAYMLDHWADAIDPNEVDNSGKTALMHFCSNSRAPGAGTFSFYVRSEHETREFLEILLHHGCDPHARDISGRSAMHWAVAMESKWMRVVRTSYALQYLLGIGSLDCNQRDDKGVTTLMLASVGSLDSLQALLSHPQIDVNVQDEGGKTALHWCCRSGIPEALEMLLSHPRVNRHITDQRGLSALDFACARWGLHGVNAIYILAKSGHWEDSAIRRAVIQFFARQYGTETSHKSTLISPQQSPATFGVFEWTLDDPTTWVLLGYALRDTCRFAAYLVLVNCGILPPSKTVEEEKRYCHCPVVSELQCCSRSWGSWALETQRSAYWRDEYAST
ncbi:ankyrin repeat-containing domain protein, partial [Ephemerocybe angulata]